MAFKVNINEIRILYKNMYREYKFLNNKYKSILVSTILVQLSDKIGTVLDTIIIGFLLGSLYLPAINIVTPFLFLIGCIYTLYGNGGSILSLKAKNEFDYEKTNKYFTLSIIGSVLVSFVYSIFIFIFADFLLHALNTPKEIFIISKTYLLIITGFFILNTYIKVLSFFIKSDGEAKLTLRAILIANILNIILDFVLYKLLEPTITSIALALVIGYLISAIYISRYYFKKDASFKLVSLSKISFKDFIQFTISALHSTPELIGRIFLTVKTSVILYLCATFLGTSGLLAYLVYDNVATIFYLTITGIMNAANPIITLFYNENDYPAVKFIMKKSVGYVLIVTLVISSILIIYPEILLKLFSITSLNQQKIVTTTIILTSIGLIGKNLCLILINYTQSISKFNISAIMNFMEEFACPLIFLPLCISQYAGIGIWIAITLSEIVTTSIYPLLVRKYKRKDKDSFVNTLLMVQDSESIYWTITRGTFEELDASMQKSNKEIIKSIESIFSRDYLIITKSLECIAKNIFNEEKNINKIDISIINNKDQTIIRLIHEGNAYNPFENEKLSQFEYIKNLKTFKYSFDYYRLFELNFSYINIDNSEIK
ncbi:MATE family efflux transporter [uncultured Methanobrevibacter sp.]|uniref:MATE family efflux transporter n=1 Tax=uncultured Methanobrevibacter sp. TaxID=253161 RepID=UPI0025D5C851|nr:MATE family efflux transporter [uncultured Methanobrevibacter sp.]